MWVFSGFVKEGWVSECTPGYGCACTGEFKILLSFEHIIIGCQLYRISSTQFL